ncbi:DUF1697 domain-containing protein [Leeuwenhoekiella sp. H156]|uniref:DUF1697 domain-containing protein n=1 Tax=Leeuwenhoekiella sp. H156 TaxID=3450128 RepID=UPI003FA4AA0A
MSQKIALLRGINVGGHRIIKMADLKKLMTDLDFTSVKTYIQSGNIVFEAADQISEALSTQIKEAIAARFGFEVPVLVLNGAELEEAVNQNPYLNTEIDLSSLHLTLLSKTPETNKIVDLMAFDSEPDAFTIKDRFIYLKLDTQYHKTKISNAFFEKKLGVEATTRNRKTILKLMELSKS